jgi:hypothetical protein
MANIQIADLAQIENQFAELSDLELEGVVGGKGNSGSSSRGRTGGSGRGGALVQLVSIIADAVNRHI